MFDRTHPQSGADRSGDEVFGRMLFGGRRGGLRQPAVPAMERVLPQTQVAPANGAENLTRDLPCPGACSLAMVYSPAQEWRGLYSVDEAIRKGTLFTELDKPFLGRTLSGR